jgi:hypothetical protein
MAFCPNCGNQQNPDATTCSNCGGEITPGAAATGGAQPPIQTPQPPSAPPPPGPGVMPPQYPGPGVMPPQYPGPGTLPMVQSKSTSGLAVASLVLAISGFICLPVLGPILGIIFGILAKSQIKRESGRLQGGGMATAGIVISVIAIVLILAVAVPVGIWFYNTVKEPMDVTNNYIQFVNDGNTTSAYNLLASDSPIRQQYTKAEFASEVVDPHVGDLDSWNANNVSITNDQATVTVDMKLATGSRLTTTFDLVRVNGTWYIYDYR